VFEQPNLLAKMTMRLFQAFMALDVQPWLLTNCVTNLCQMVREPSRTFADAVAMDPPTINLKEMDPPTLNPPKMNPKMIMHDLHQRNLLWFVAPQ
jgi:hypothetical protein